MPTMQAFQMIEWGKAPDYREVAIPEPGPGQVVLKMAGAGLCGTDLHVIHSPAGVWTDPPFTLGHENAGYVSALGSGVTNVAEGDAVLVSSVGHCGRCDKCGRGRENECRALVMVGYGLGLDGGLAEYMLVAAKDLVRLGNLNPLAAAPLADAGATSYHAVQEALPLLRPGATAVVIGAGGLGAYAVQYLRLLTAAHLITIDVAQPRLDNARRLGSHEAFPFDADIAQRIREHLGRGADVILDFVGTTDTLSAAMGALDPGGALLMVGLGPGEVTIGWSSLAPNSRIQHILGWTLPELNEVVRLATDGHIQIESTVYPFDRISDGLAALETANVAGRAVVAFP